MPKQRGSTKQYCAEPEIDPYESWYRKSDLFLDYMNEAPCKIPKVEEHKAEPVELLETIESIDLPAHRLTGKVRCQYLNFLEKLLLSNYEKWSSTVEPYENVTFTPSEIKRCAESLEMKAVQSCMVVSLYRNYVLKVISQLRKETKDASLHPNLINMKFTPRIIKKECCNVSVQTDTNELQNIPQEPPPSVDGDLPLLDVPAMSLDEKIRNFEKKMHIISPELNAKRSKKARKDKAESKDRKKSRNKDRIIGHKSKISTSDRDPSHEKYAKTADCSQYEQLEMPSQSNVCNAAPGQPPIPLLEDDHIMRELEAMFDTGDDENIFDSCENQVQIKAIMSEIEQFDPSKASESCKSTKGYHALQELPLNPSPTFHYQGNSGDPGELDICKDLMQNVDDKKADLKKSPWPCEFHMQKMKLRELLSNIADNNYLKYERIRARFIILFGEYEEEEDELGPYSPSIELNDVLISSCRQRIAKWVVQALMKPLNEGLIGNRFLFKRLAKHLADGIIYLNQYPDQRYIKNYVVDYFCTHPAILTAEDME